MKIFLKFAFAIDQICPENSSLILIANFGPGRNFFPKSYWTMRHGPFPVAFCAFIKYFPVSVLAGHWRCLHLPRITCSIL